MTDNNKLIQALRNIKAGDIMTKNVITTTEDTKLSDLAEFLIQTRISGLPVADENGKINGIITATDLFALMDMIKSGILVEDGKDGVFNPTVKLGMCKELLKINKEATLDEIIDIMNTRNVHTIPVFENDEMVGVIGRRDVFKNFYATVSNLTDE